MSWTLGESIAYRQGQRDATAEALTVLADHYLADVICGDHVTHDPHPGQDNPVCGCSRVFLGWHPSIGAARQAWIDHVAEILSNAR